MDDPGHRVTTRRSRSALIALLALLLCGVLASAASADTTQDPFDGTNFQAGDGNQLAEGGHLDWQSIVGSVRSAADPFDADDPVGGFTGGSKETEPGAWTLTSIGSPPKDNILDGWARTDVVGDHTILYLAFRRETPNGNTFLTFELNKRTDTWDNDGDDSTPEIPCREDDDVLVSYEVEPGGTTEPDPVTIRLYTWEELIPDAATGCSVSGQFSGGEVLNDPALANPLAQAAINEDGDIANFLPTGDGATQFGQGTFGEAAIDVSAVFDAVGKPCFDFGQIQMHSRASSAIDSELKDFTGPIDLPVGSCTASGVKFEDLDFDGAPREVGEPGLAGWIIFADYDNDGVLDANEPSDVTDANGVYTISDLTQPYTLREQPGPTVTGEFVCSYPGNGSAPDGSGSLGGSFPCGWGPIDPNVTPTVLRDFGNARVLHPAIKVDKKVRNAGEGDFVDGPIQTTVGKTLQYQFTVTNPGDAALTVVVSDPRCNAGTLSGPTGAGTEDSLLQPGEVWVYTCSHVVTASDPDPLPNTVTATGTHPGRPPVSDRDSALADIVAQVVLPQPEIVSGAARLRGPSGCVKGPFKASVRGRRIAEVVFFVDGKRFKKLTAPTGEGSRFTVTINPRGRSFGVHRITARVRFAAESQTAARTLRLSFQRCKRETVRPRFTG